MANTSRLREVTDYVIEDLSKKFELDLAKRKVPVGRNNILKEFSAVSADRNTVIYICHHSGRTSGGKTPVGKINGLFSKCFLLEKTSASKRFIYFTNEEFYNIFKEKSNGLLENIELRWYANLTTELKLVLEEVYSASSKEMTK